VEVAVMPAQPKRRSAPARRRVVRPRPWMNTTRTTTFRSELQAKGIKFEKPAADFRGGFFLGVRRFLGALGGRRFIAGELPLSSASAGVVLPCGASSAARFGGGKPPRSGSILPLQQREEHHVANAGRAGEHHDQAVDADANAACGRHAVLKRLDEVVVDLLRFLA